MKKVLMTGLTGSLGPVVAQQFTLRGWQIIEWNHHHLSPDDIAASEQFFQQHEPDAVCHMAMGSEAWTAWLAAQCAQRNIPYLFTSTAMVFDAAINGPYSISCERNSQDEYGLYKIRCEDQIWKANPNAMIARLGWQLHDKPAGNNMLSHLDKLYEKEGAIHASTLWYPATSHMDDTAIACLQLIERNEPGLYHLDSNALERWSFYELVCALKDYYKRDWKVIPSSDYSHDQRLQDDRIALPPLSHRFVRNTQS